jgi:PITH domain
VVHIQNDFFCYVNIILPADTILQFFETTMDPNNQCTGHTHDHEHSADLGLSLRTYIDFTKVTCFNEVIVDSGRMILKIQEERTSAQPCLLSPEDDPELLMYIPFTEAVSIQTISIHNSSNNTETSSPRRVKLFTNRDDLDFETARELPPQQELELLPPAHFDEGTIDYPCRPAGRFQAITSLTIFIADNYDGSGVSATEITFIGLKGKGTNMKRVAVNAIYEVRGMYEDHKVEGGMFGTKDVL